MLLKLSALIYCAVLLHSHLSLIIKAHESETHSRRAQYGEPCNKTTRCHTNALLTCKNALCECQKPDSMSFDPILGQCLVLVGEKCRFTLANNDEESSYSPQQRVLEEEINCVQNAWCNRAGVCMCVEGHVGINNGTCMSKRKFEESCTTDTECRQDRFLQCTDGRCGCNETVSTYNPLIRQCVGKAGFPCLGSFGCVYNADCTSNNVAAQGFKKRRTRNFVETCRCNQGFVVDSSGYCKVGLKGDCSSTKPCADKLLCKDGQCVCKYENVQLPIARLSACISLVGGPCNETVPTSGVIPANQTLLETFQCVDNAQCAASDEGLYECKCAEGFVENSNGFCDLAFGQPCNHYQIPYPSTVSLSDNKDTVLTTSWNKDLVCDRVTPLFCVMGTCQCESFLYEYASLRSKCLGKVGAKCLLNTGATNITHNTECIPGAECTATRGSATFTHGKCICSEGYTPTSNRTCAGTGSSKI